MWIGIGIAIGAGLGVAIDNIAVGVAVGLCIAFSSQRLQTNWPAVIAHLLGNLAFFLMILAGVLEMF